MQLTGSTVVVTGASSGIGLATARGARLVLTARAAERLQRAAGEVRGLGGRRRARLLAATAGLLAVGAGAGRRSR